MTEYTTENVAELVAEARGRAQTYEGMTRNNWIRFADALEAVSAEREEAFEIRTSNARRYRARLKKAWAERDTALAVITEALDCLRENEDRDEVAIGILSRATVQTDKEGQANDQS